MKLNPSELALLSQWLDEALDQEPAALEAWLRSLPAEQAHLVEPLRGMLESRRTSTFMAELPQLHSVDEGGPRGGDPIGPYRLLRPLGQGGMGTVWLAERADGSMRRQVALKMPRLTWGDGLAERMVRERDIGVLLEHPNIARLYDAGLDAQGRPFLAFEYIDGRPIDAWCRQEGFSVVQRLRLFLQVARALAHAHGRLVVHRDIKPSNVLVSADGQVHLLDFGIAKLLDDAAADTGLTQQYGRAMTLSHAAPEQIAGLPVGLQADVYSLGVLLHELLTGQLPFAPRRASVAALEEAILEGDAPAASTRAPDAATARALRGELDAIIAKALQRDLARRYPTTDALAEDIERFLRGDTVSARPDTLTYRAAKALRRHRIGFAALAAVLLAVLGGAAASVVQAQRAQAAAERARVVKEFVIDVFRLNERGNPENRALREQPAEVLLERGARLIGSRFPGQPQLQAELFGVVAGIFLDMGDAETAAEYATRQIEALGQSRSDASARVAAQLLLADALSAQGRLADAEVRARRALDSAAGETDSALDARLMLAQVLLTKGELDAAVDQLDRIEAGLPSAPVTLRHAKTRAARAELAAARNDTALAVSAYRAAISLALQAEGEWSALAIKLRLLLADGLMGLGRPAEARPLWTAAIAAMRVRGGEEDIGAALAEAELAGWLAGSESMDPASFADAEATLKGLQQRLAAQGRRVPLAVRAQVDVNLGELYRDWGDIAQCGILLERAAPVLLNALEEPVPRATMALALAKCRREAGRHAEAEPLFREALNLYAAGPPNARNLYYVEALARNLLMQRRLDDAEALVAEWPAGEPTTGGPHGGHVYGDAIAMLMAEISLERGDAAGALKRLPPDRSGLPAAMSEELGLIRASAACISGRPAEGLPVLERAIARRAQVRHPAHPEIARLRGLAGLCALAAGQPRLARDLASQAQTAFESQPAVSAFYKEPLQRLQRRLQLNRPA